VTELDDIKRVLKKQHDEEERRHRELLDALRESTGSQPITRQSAYDRIKKGYEEVDGGDDDE
jgi:hypothetical protein